MSGDAARVNALVIDTTSDFLSLALMKEGRTVASVYDEVGRAAAREILPRIGAMLSGAGLKARALDVVMAARGPGSFTGTRIGLAVALTFAQVTGRPLIGVDTLRLLAAQTAPGSGGENEARFHVLLNCARDEVYHAVFRRGEGGAEGEHLPEMEGEIALGSLKSLLPKIGKAPVVLRRFKMARPRTGRGEGTGRGDPETEAAFAALKRLPLAHPNPDGERLLAVGLPLYLAGPGAGWPPVTPIYLKSEAFRTWRPSP